MFWALTILSFMKHLTFAVAAAALLCNTTLSAQCDDTNACNYDPMGTEACNYNTSGQDLSQGVLLGIPFGQYALDTTATCAVQPINDNLVQMSANAEGLFQFVVDQAVMDYFAAAVAGGAVTQAEADQFLGLMTYSTFSFCDTVMTSNLPGLGSFESSWTGSHWMIDPVGYYVAPASNLSPGCSDPEATNFDLCALIDDSLCTYAVEGCEDPLACNYEEGTTGTENCVYFDTDNFTIGENDFIDIFSEECASGYAGWNDLPVPLAQDSTGGPLYFVLFDAVEDILVQFGYQAMVDDILTVSMSVCGDTMNYNSIYGDYDFAFDGMGFVNTIYGGYIAPESSFPYTCSDPEACNFDPCSHPFGDDCEYLMPGTLTGDTLITTDGAAVLEYAAGEGNTVEWFSACAGLEVDGNMATLTSDTEGSCEVCVTESNADGCVAETTCINVTIETADNVSDLAFEGSVMPNPASNAVRIAWQGAPTRWTLCDEQGREVKSLWVTEGIQTLDVSDLAPGMYLAGPHAGAKTRLAILK